MRCSQIVKHFTLAVLIAFSGIMLTGCGEDEAAKAAADKAEAEAQAKADANIKIVKEAVLPNDKSRNIEDVLTATLKDLSWKAYRTHYNQEIVEVNGIWRRGTIKQGGDTYLVHDGNKVCLRFLINKDKTVNFYGARVESNKRDLGYYYHANNGNGDNIREPGIDMFYYIPAEEKFNE
jgi:hypothetical protein